MNPKNAVGKKNANARVVEVKITAPVKLASVSKALVNVKIHLMKIVLA